MAHIHHKHRRLTEQFRLWSALLGLPAFFLLSFLFWPLGEAGAEGCAGPTISISSLHGPDGSPREGDWVTLEAQVTGDFTGEDQLDGFFIQQRRKATDKAASSGLFVYAPQLEGDLSRGERVRVRGQVSQYHGMTQLSRARIEARCGEAEPVEPEPLSLPFDGAQRERLQAMRVRLEPPLVVTGNHELGRYGVLKLADERLYRPTQVAQPGGAARQVAEANEQRMIRLDDGSRRQFPEPVPYPEGGLAADNTVRVGDELEAVEGILDYRYGDWRIQPVEPPGIKHSDTRPEGLDTPAEGVLRIASFNVENYFNGDGQGGGFPTERGARTPEAFERQQAKLFSALAGLEADIVGLIEMENDGYGPDSALASFTRGAGSDWSFIRAGETHLGGDAIRVALIYREDRVAPVGEAETLKGEPFEWGNRQPLAQRFRSVEGGPAFWVVVNHLKSKICGNHAEGDDRAQGDGQGCWNARRVQAVEAQLEWLEELKTDSGNARVLLMGDLNAYAREDPLRLFHEAGYRDLVNRQDDSPGHSYVFRGQSGTLDYALGSGEIEGVTRDAGIWSINADEPVVLGYDTDSRLADQPLYGPGPWRSSDHDPTWVDIRP